MAKIKKAQKGMTMKQLKSKYPTADTTAKGDVRGTEMNAYAPKKELKKYNDTYNAFERKFGNKPAKDKKGGIVKKAKTGTSLGMKSVKAGVDKNPGVTRADIIVAGQGKAKKGKMVKKAQVGKQLPPAPKKKGAMDAIKDLGKYVSTFGLATEKYNPAPSKAAKKAAPKNKMGGKTKKCAYGCK